MKQGMHGAGRFLESLFKPGSETKDIRALIRSCPDHLFENEFGKLVAQAEAEHRYGGNEKQVRYMAANHWSDSQDTPLVIAALAGKENAVSVLIAAGARVNEGTARYDRRMYPLAAALEHGSVQMVQQMLAAGADPNASNSFYSHALFFAIHDQDKFNLLMEAGASIEMFMARHPDVQSAIVHNLRACQRDWVTSNAKSQTRSRASLRAI